MENVIIGVDLGGTRLRAASLNTNLEIIQREEILTQADEGLEATLQRVQDVIHAVWPVDKTVLGIGLSAPGPLNPKTGVVVAPPNLPGWHDVPLGDRMSAEFDVPIFVGNDANVAVLAEMAVGAARGYRHVIYLTVSTGIGSGIVNDGRLILGQVGLGGEAGHIIMMAEDGSISSLEKLAAGPALARQAQERIHAGEESILLQLAGGYIDDITAKLIGDAANQHDLLALEIARRGGHYVGLGIVSLLHIFNPEIIVIGGGVSYIGDIWFEEIRKAVHANVLDDDYWQNTPIVASEISEDVSIIGSAMLVVTEGGSKRLGKAMKKLSNN